MRLNPDCVRDVLLTVEDAELDEHISPATLHRSLPQYSEEEIAYTCLMLGDGGYLTVMTVNLPMQSVPGVKSVSSLTYAGHEFAANIRKDTVWAGIKNVATKIGTTSLPGLTQIAANVVTELIKSHFGL